MYIPDHQIQHLCSEAGYPKVWSPSGGPDIGRQFDISNPGPLIEGFDPVHLGPASYDIAVGLKFASPQGMEIHIRRGGTRHREIGKHDITEFDGAKHVKGETESVEIVLMPSQAVLCHSAEYVRIPPTLAAELSMRSSFAREWLDHSAADRIWPGFQGNITFELRNNGPRPYSLRSGVRPLQLSFMMMAGVPRRPYNGLYQNQDGQLHSRLPREE